MKAKLLPIEAFAIAKVVLCWTVGLSALVLSLFAFTIWDTAALAAVRARGGRGGTRLQLRRANAGHENGRCQVFAAIRPSRAPLCVVEGS
jgi:hypothetical protein